MNKRQRMVVRSFFIYLVLLISLTFTGLSNTLSDVLGLRKMGLYFGDRFVTPEDGFLTSHVEEAGQWWPRYSSFFIYLGFGLIIAVILLMLFKEGEKLFEKSQGGETAESFSWIKEKLKTDTEGQQKPAPQENVSGEKSSQLSESRQELAASRERELENGDKLLYLGRRYSLQVDHEEVKAPSIKFYRGKFMISVPAALKDEEEKTKAAIREQLIKWYREHAESKIKERVEEYKEKTGITPDKITVKKLKDKWSTSSDYNLIFDWRIIMAPLSVVDSIIVPELVGLKYGSDSRKLKKEVKEIIPDYEKEQQWIKENIEELNI